MGTSSERIRALIAGKLTDNYINTATWKTVPVRYNDSDSFTKMIIDYSDQYRCDFVKIPVCPVNGSGTHEIGARNTKKINKIYEFRNLPIKNIDNLWNISDIELDEMLDHKRNVENARRIAGYYNGDVPVLPTLFSSFSLLRYLTDGGLPALKYYINKEPKAVHKALEYLNEMNKEIVDEYISVGVDGIFFVTSFTSPLTVSSKEFEEFNRQYDVELLSYANQKGWFNILHIHGITDLYIKELAYYPVTAINWENCAVGIDEERLTSPGALRKLTDKILIGGIDQFYDFYGTVDKVTNNLEERLDVMLRQIPDKRFIFSCGCSVPYDIDSRNIGLVRKVADKYSW